MEEYLNGLFKSFWSYIRATPDSKQWWLMVVTVMSVWIVAFILSKGAKSSIFVTREFKILQRLIVAAIIVQTLLVGYFSYQWRKGEIYLTDNEKLVHLGCLLLCIVLQLAWTTKLGKTFSQEKKLGAINTSFTKSMDEEKTRVARLGFNRLRLASALPLAGLLFTLLPTKSNLVAFLLDNSSSMEEHLENGKQVLRNSVHEMGDNVDIVLSLFTETKTPKEDIGQILASTDYTSLNGNHILLDKKEGANMYLDTISATTIKTPLIESIWSTYLFLSTTESYNSQPYNSRNLVLVTDGKESYVKNYTDDFLCTIPAFSDYFGQNISIINLDPDEITNTFFSYAESTCGYVIYQGESQDNYVRSINEILNDVSNDKYFPVWILILSILGSVVTLLIQSKRA